MKFSKNSLQNDHLLQDLKQEAWADDVIKTLRRRRITTYKQLFTLIRDDQADTRLRTNVCDEIGRLFIWVDRRRFVPPLLDALNTTHQALLQKSIQALANLESKRAVDPIIKLVSDKTLSYETRRFAILALCNIKVKKALPALINIMLDRGDEIKVREDAIEQTAWFFDPSLVRTYTQLLSDPEPDMRFWAAYGFAVMRTDISEALGELDRVAAFDHIAPDGWWHIDREAFDALENIYWQRLELDDGESPRKEVYIISPAPEYSTFQWLFNRLSESKHKRLLPPDLKVQPDWLAEKIQGTWPTAKLNVRDPRPQTYLVDWLIEIDGEPLIGGLHRDQYTVVITGSPKAVRVFASWYRSIIEPEQYLFLYEWAGLAVELRLGMNEVDVETEQRERSNHMNAIEERSVHYPWIIKTE